jgi:hypothetical protein
LVIVAPITKPEMVLAVAVAPTPGFPTDWLHEFVPSVTVMEFATTGVFESVLV